MTLPRERSLAVMFVAFMVIGFVANLKYLIVAPWTPGTPHDSPTAHVDTVFEPPPDEPKQPATTRRTKPRRREGEK